MNRKLSEANDELRQAHCAFVAGLTCHLHPFSTDRKTFSVHRESLPVHRKTFTVNNKVLSVNNKTLATDRKILIVNNNVMAIISPEKQWRQPIHH